MVVSVVTATWHRPAGLARAARSVLAQTVHPVEHIVVSDGPDPDVDPPQGCRYVYLGRNFRSFREVSSRGADPRGVGAMLATGDYIAYLDDDNEYLPHHLAACIAELERTGADFLTSQARRDDGSIIGDGIFGLGHLDTNTIVHRATCLRAGNWIATPGECDDYDLVRRWREAGLAWHFYPEITVLYHRKERS